MLQEANLERAFLQNIDLQQANLQKANMYKANLQGANLYCSNLREAKLTSTILTKAFLNEADLCKAKLLRSNMRKASLFRANLTDANLQEADLFNADLMGANLTRTNMQKANLQETNLTGAILFETNFRLSNLGRSNLFKSDIKNTNFENTQLAYIVVDEELAEKIPIELQNLYRYTWDIRKIGGEPIFNQNIIRSIELPSEYYQLGMLILTHLGKVLREKHSGKTFKFRIEQDGLKVTMIVETSEKDKESIEDTIRDYGLVIMGQMSPEEFITDRNQLKELKDMLNYITEQVKKDHTDILQGVKGLLPAFTHVIQSRPIIPQKYVEKDKRILKRFTVDYEIIIEKAGFKRKALLIINNEIEISITPLMFDICVILVNKLKEGWKGINRVHPDDIGWVHYDDFTKEIESWNAQTEEATIRKAIRRINKKIKYELKLAETEKNLIENGYEYGHNKTYRFRVHSKFIRIE